MVQALCLLQAQNEAEAELLSVVGRDVTVYLV
jgi:hypothetical protein